MAKIEDCLPYVLVNEGGFTIDDGGPTNFGIVASDVAKYRGIPVSSVTETMMRNLTEAEATAIYAAQYFTPMRLNEVNDRGIATACLDAGVNFGISAGAKYAQRALNLLGGALVVDGEIGVHTTSALNLIDVVKFIKAFENLVAAGYLAIIAHNPAMSIYERGWMARATRLLTLMPPRRDETLMAP